MSNQDLIIVEQLPVIKEQLERLSQEIDLKVKEALAMECTEDNKQTVKNKRAELKKDFNDLEERRKEVKKQVLEPYNKFEEIYKKCVTEKFTVADKELKSKIDAIETEQKKRLEDEARDFFNESIASNNIDFLQFEDLNLKIGISDNPTKLKKQIIAFIGHIVDDIKLIDTQDDKEEILVEYKSNGYKVSDAITIVKNRHALVEKEKEIQENYKAQAEDLNNKLSNFQQEETVLQAPKVEKVEEKQLSATFTVKATNGKLKALVNFMNQNNIKWKQVVNNV